ncbi:MAG: histidinol-phosphatase [candidate division Zixibacteria bacterium]
MTEKIGKYYYYSGVVHVHTTESDGTKPLSELTTIANKADLDFMLVSDHMNLNNRGRNLEGFYGKLLVLVGYEHNDINDENHFLIFGSPKVYPSEMSPAEYVAAVRNDGALGIMAHPDETRNRMVKYPPYPWTDWSVDDVDGIELWNQMSEWMEKLTPSNRLAMAFSPRKSMVGPTDRLLAKWDTINAQRKCVGIASADAHAFPIPIGPFKVEIFPYKVHFRALRTHLLLREELSRDFHSARDQIYAALRDCRAYLSNMRWGNAETFEFWAVSPQRSVTMGGQIEHTDGVTLKVKLQDSATIKLVGNGKVIAQTVSDRLEYSVETDGIYRVEAWKGKRGWIFSNHIRIGK